MSFTSLHHSFDIQLATIYGVEEAILIHHFQHWIRINSFAGRNFRDGRTWSYQTRKDIQAHFPYWDVERIRYMCNQLVNLGVLITANFNKTGFDKTLWYAFVDEKKFGVDQESSRNLCGNKEIFTNGKIPTSSGKIPNGCGKIPKPIPDTKNTDTKNTEEERKKEKKERGEPLEPPISADAESLCDFFLSKIKERHPKFKDPNKAKWLREFDCILRIDKRDLLETKALILWASEHNWWQAACLSPAKLRKDFDTMSIQMKSDEDKSVVRDNRAFALSMKEKHPKEMKGLTFDSKYAINSSKAEEIPFSLPRETFQRALINMFGGEYVPG